MVGKMCFAQMNHLGFPNAWAYCPSLDYVNLQLKDENKEVKYRGYGFNNRGSFSLLSMIFQERKFFIHENIDISLIGMTMGNRTVSMPGAETQKGFSAGILVGYNLGMTIGYISDKGIGAGLNYVFFGGNYITDLEYDFSTSNRGLAELRVMVGPFLGQIGHSFNYNRNRMWNGMLAFWFGDDPTEANVNLFLRGEYNTTLYSPVKQTKYTVFSLGLTLLY